MWIVIRVHAWNDCWIDCPCSSVHLQSIVVSQPALFVRSPHIGYFPLITLCASFNESRFHVIKVLWPLYKGTFLNTLCKFKFNLVVETPTEHYYTPIIFTLNVKTTNNIDNSLYKNKFTKYYILFLLSLLPMVSFHTFKICVTVAITLLAIHTLTIVGFTIPATYYVQILNALS